MKIISRHKQLIPLIVLFAFSSKIILNLFAGQVISGKNIITLSVIILNFLCYFLVRKYFKYTWIITLIAGFFNLIPFTYLKYSMQLGLNGNTGISFQPLAVALLLLTYFINFKRFNNFIMHKEADEHVSDNTNNNTHQTNEPETI